MSFESDWWGNCVNTSIEERKQFVYAEHMGLEFRDCGGPGLELDLKGRSVLDFGGGPVSLLLKCVGGISPGVVDPLPLPEWAFLRYVAAGIRYVRSSAEGFQAGAVWDECWIYNTLQHVLDPQRVIEVARASALLIRIFEWVDLDPHPGHPHRLEQAQLEAWLGDRGQSGHINRDHCVGKAFWGVFRTEAAAAALP